MEIALIIVVIVLLIVNIVITINKGKEKGEIEGLKAELIRMEAGITGVNSLVREEFGRNREEIQKQGVENRKEQADSLKSFEEKFSTNVKDLNEQQRQKFSDFGTKQDQLKTDTENKLEKIRETVEKKITQLQDENTKKLEEMRVTVDEKLQATLEKRFNDSFTLISERLEQVHKGLGEMQTLATGVGDLKKVLTNVKTRGTFGEIQLGVILEQIMSPIQYSKNVIVNSSTKQVIEYVVNIPNKNDDSPLLLPIDSKFPIEDYQRLIEAYENGSNVEVASKLFENSIKKCANDISTKYINPPVTTDFAIMFVPTEGLYAEVLRRTGLFETLQRDYKVTVVGPTNLAAYLSSLQMGFRTLAIQKHTNEVWQVLGAVKTEFGKFGVLIDKTHRKLVEATNDFSKVGVRTRAIERQLRTVDALPDTQTTEILGPALEIETEDEL